jgi:hypothetical protein
MSHKKVAGTHLETAIILCGRAEDSLQRTCWHDHKYCWCSREKDARSRLGTHAMWDG